MTKREWERDFDKLSAALLPYVFQIDGQDYIDPAAPEWMTRPYGVLLSAGYFYGWL